MRKIIFIFIFILNFALIARAEMPITFYGTAIQYSDSMKGQKTASGQIYDPSKLTAAHRTFPIGTVIELKNMDNNKKVRVTINDRGPVNTSYQIKISKATAEALGIKGRNSLFVSGLVVKLGDGSIPGTKTVGTNAVSLQTSVVKTNMSSAETKSQTVLTQEVVVTTNIVLLTNTINIYVTNIVTNSAFSTPEKVTERVLKENPLNLNLKADTNIVQNNSDKDFIREEPVDESPEPVNDLDSVLSSTNKNVIDLDTIPVIKQPETSETNQASATNTNNSNNAATDNLLNLENIENNEIELTPDLLLTNDTVIDAEKNEIDKELSNEINTGEEQETNEEKVLTNKAIQKESPFEKQPVYVADAYGYSYAIQVGAFRKERNALKLYGKLLKRGFAVFTVEKKIKGRRFIRVRIGYFGSLSEAQAVRRKLKALKLPVIMVKLKLESE